ncbi:hypothetical protein NIES4101_27260 (plasmid) [Calothrix sp. NIES-4101]|nr:hypothetical protein NIES4101_27260 [Calothrix sp. NIES-4101]
MQMYYIGLKPLLHKQPSLERQYMSTHVSDRTNSTSVVCSKVAGKRLKFAPQDPLTICTQ